MSGLTYGDNLGPDTFSSETQDGRKQNIISLSAPVNQIRHTKIRIPNVA